MRFGAVRRDADRRMLEAGATHSEFVINSAFVIRISSFSVMRSLPGGDNAALHPHLADRLPCRRLPPAKSPDSARANVSRRRANVPQCVRVGSLIRRTEWP